MAVKCACGLTFQSEMDFIRHYMEARPPLMSEEIHFQKMGGPVSVLPEPIKQHIAKHNLIRYKDAHENNLRR